MNKDQNTIWFLYKDVSIKTTKSWLFRIIGLIFFRFYMDYLTMNNEVRLAIVTDDPPVREDVRAWGMCRVNARLFRALSDYIAVIACGSIGHPYRKNDLIEEIRDRCVMGTSISNVIRFGGCIFPCLSSTELEFKLSLPHVVHRIRKSNANWIFCPCGVNPYALWRGLRIAQACKLPFAVYLVDDFLSGAILSGNKDNLLAAHHGVPKWLNQADQIFVVSAGLRSRVKELYGLNSSILPFPYDPPTDFVLQPQESKERQVIFVGNISHFYVDGLRQMAAILDELNKQEDCHLTLKLTLPSLRDAHKLLGNFECIRCKPCEDNEALLREIHSSVLCFAPYSFDEKYRVMVSTSFPSKIMDYLSAARLIVVYGPEYASSVVYFRNHALKEVIYSQNNEALKDVVIRQLRENKDYSKAYHDIVQKFHAPNYIADQIISTLASCKAYDR